MDIQLLTASAEYKDVIKNLLQLYIYDFSEFVNCDVDENGLYVYPHFEDYWNERKDRFAYAIKADENYAGFVFVKRVETGQHSYFSIAEFFILKKYRRNGIGTIIAHRVFNLHSGEWQVYEMENNKPAQHFWISVIDAYTKGQFTERFENGRRIQGFGN